MASFQAVLLMSMAVLAMAVGHSSAAWCVCKDGPDTVLQKTLDFACGHGGDCNPIKANGACYNPNTVKAHCSYAANSFYQRMSQHGATCDFGSTATLTASDPSSSGCSYPASASSAGSSGTTPVTTVPSTGNTPVTTTPVSGTTPTTSSPYTTSPSGATPSTGVLGGVGTGLTPTGMGMGDESKAGMIRLESITIALCCFVLGLVLHLWN